MSAHSMRQRSKRSWLTMIGIFIGVAAVVALIGLGQGLQNAINDEFLKLGLDTLIISPAGAIFGAGGANTLSQEDIDLLDKVRGVKNAAGFAFTTAEITWDDEQWFHMVMGMPDDKDDFETLTFGSWEIEKGRQFEKGENHKAIVGYDYAYSDAFNEKLLVGDKVDINGVSFDVIGSFSRVGNSNDDRTIVIPEETFRELFDIPDRIDSIIVKTQEGQEPSVVAQRVEETMRRDRNLKEGNEDFSVQTTEDLMDSFGVILDIVTIVLAGLAAISSLVGAVGIMNTMYTAVLERTKEIGIMKAIGARNSDVLTMFLIESGLLGMVGGIIGIILGILLSLGFAAAAQYAGFELLKANFPWWLILGALLGSFGFGILAGFLPALQAARKNPVDSLRYE